MSHMFIDQLVKKKKNNWCLVRVGIEIWKKTINFNSEEGWKWPVYQAIGNLLFLEVAKSKDSRLFIDRATYTRGRGMASSTFCLQPWADWHEPDECCCNVEKIYGFPSNPLLAINAKKTKIIIFLREKNKYYLN